jgi:ABC-2 type transport system permease protein
MNPHWALADGWTMTNRNLAHWARQPGQVIVSLLFSVLVVLMFGYLFGGGMTLPGGGDYREFLVPGMFAMTMLFGIESTFASMVTDASRGVTDRFRSMPMAPSAVVVGRAGADMLTSAVALVALIVAGLAIGWRAREGLAAAALAVGLLLLFRFAILWMGIYLGLVVNNPEAVVAVQILVWPLAFLSNALAAPETMPAWLGAAAEWNPMSATVAATRDLFGNPVLGGETWAGGHPLFLAVAWPVLLVAVFFPLSVRAYRRLGH